MAKDYKYEDSTPVDEPVRKGSKVQEPGSGIRVRPLSDMERAEEKIKLKEMQAARFSPEAMEKRYMEKRGALDEAKKSKVNAMGDTYAKGGMTASKRADGCCTKGKTRGKMM